MSFELYGAIKSREFLNEQQAPRDLADGVAETVNRHTDFVAGEATTHVQLIQLGTLLVRAASLDRLTGRTTTACTASGSPSRRSTRSSRRTRVSAGTVRSERIVAEADAPQKASRRRWKTRSRRSRGASTDAATRSETRRSHTTCLKPGIWKDSRGNKFMAQYE